MRSLSVGTDQRRVPFPISLANQSTLSIEIRNHGGLNLNCSLSPGVGHTSTAAHYVGSFADILQKDKIILKLSKKDSDGSNVTHDVSNFTDDLSDQCTSAKT